MQQQQQCLPPCLCSITLSQSSFTLFLLLDTPRHDVVGVSSCVCVGMWKITRFIAYDCRYNLLICRTIFTTSLPRSLYSFLFPLFVLARNFNVNIEYKSDYVLSLSPSWRHRRTRRLSLARHARATRSHSSCVLHRNGNGTMFSLS